MVAGVDNSKKIEHIIKIIRSTIELPLSIDSVSEKEILSACDSKIDFIMSLDAKNLHLASNIDVPAVIIPRDINGRIAVDKIDYLQGMIDELTKIGYNNFVVDPLLEPVCCGFIDSIKNYIEFRNKHPTVLMLMGAGNVTELLDADSIGINALLAGIVAELGIELLFTTEASPKTSGCVRELSNAVEIMYLAEKRGQPPKDLGINLLRLKDKRRLEPVVDSKGREMNFIKVQKTKPTIEDISFNIYLTDGKINVVQYHREKPIQGYVGVDAESLYKRICIEKKISSEHAAYLGKELLKAELALKLNKNYLQDEKLFQVS
jgi:dihydropteroate synthase-like protein